MKCPACQAENDDAAEVCFECRAVLTAVTRGTLVGGRYRIRALLGRGGMGAVYRAHDEVLDEEVALKILRPEVAGTPEMARRFRSEIKLARRVSHGNVCRIHEYGEDGALQYISMELITGGTLKDRLRGGALPADEAFELCAQVADGLSAIHKAGIVHRDLKSANVMLDASGTAKVMDFGIAKPVPTASDAGPSTGYVLGSPEYMSPEQARGRRAGPRSDLYSLGVVVFEAFTGRVPFRGTTPVETLMLHVEREPPLDDPALALPPALTSVLRSALAKDPARRFEDAAAMAEALRRARSGVVAALPPAGVEATQRLRDPAPRRRGPLLAAAAVGLVSLTVAAVLASRDRAAGVAVPSASLPPPVTSVPPALSSPSAVSPAVAESAAPPVEASAAPASVGPSPRSVKTPPTTTASAPLASPPAATAPALVPAVPSPRPPAPAGTAPLPEPTTTPGPTSPTPEPAVSPPPAEGFLLVLAVPWAEIAVDGRRVGMTPLERIPLEPGPHAIVLTHRDYLPYTRRVTIAPGETTRVRIDWARDGVRR